MVVLFKAKLHIKLIKYLYPLEEEWVTYKNNDANTFDILFNYVAVIFSLYQPIVL